MRVIIGTILAAIVGGLLYSNWDTMRDPDSGQAQVQPWVWIAVVAASVMLLYLIFA